MIQILVNENEIQTKMLSSAKYTCIDYDTLMQTRKYGWEIMTHRMIIGLSPDKRYIESSSVPCGIYQNSNYKVVVKPDRVIIEKDKKDYVLVLFKSSDLIMKLQDKTILERTNGIVVNHFFVRKDKSLYMILYSGGTRIRININYEDTTAEIKVGNNIYVIPLMSLKQVISSGGVQYVSFRYKS